MYGDVDQEQRDRERPKESSATHHGRVPIPAERPRQKQGHDSQERGQIAEHERRPA
jgi:hypothetical protein